jgi:hypothetical protein
MLSYPYYLHRHLQIQQEVVGGVDLPWEGVEAEDRHPRICLASLVVQEGKESLTERRKKRYREVQEVDHPSWLKKVAEEVDQQMHHL